MISTLKKKLNKKGFTLAELLIVIAIIAILVAIAIPVFSNQLSLARSKVDAANARSAESMAVAEYLVNSETGIVYYKTEVDANKNLTITRVNEDTAGIASEADSSKHLHVSVTDGKATSSWS